MTGKKQSKKKYRGNDLHKGKTVRCWPGADDFIQLIGRKVIVDKNITTQFREVLSMKPETSAKVMFGVAGLICGGIIAMIIGFNWGGWTTSSTTKRMTEEAVLTTQAAICVAQFVKDPNYKENLKEFEKLDSYGMENTSDYVRKHGWDKMPGGKKAAPDVADACAQGIEVIIRKRDK